MVMEDFKQKYYDMHNEQDILRKMNLKEDLKQQLRQYQEEKREKNKRVINVINEIIKYYNENNRGDALTEFLEFGCYEFAIMLKKIFKDDATVFISTSDGFHAITNVYGEFYDVRGNLSEEDVFIDFREYHKPTEEEFNYFIDICYVFKNRDYMKQFEERCDQIVYKIEEKN